MLIFEEYLNKFNDSKIRFIKDKLQQKISASLVNFLFEDNKIPFDSDTMRWITIKDKNMQNQHILVKKKDGTIVGGEHDGEKLEDVFDNVEDEKSEKKVHKNGFFHNGKEYYHSFGRYYCDGEKITREEYFRAKKEFKATSSGGSPKKEAPTQQKDKKDSKDDSKEDKLANFTKKVFSDLVGDIDFSNLSTKERLEKVPFKKCSSLQELEEHVKKFSGIKRVSLTGFSDVGIANENMRVLHKFLSRYPALGDSEFLQTLITQEGVKAYASKQKAQEDFDDYIRRFIETKIEPEFEKQFQRALKNPQEALELYVASGLTEYGADGTLNSIFSFQDEIHSYQLEKDFLLEEYHKIKSKYIERAVEVSAEAHLMPMDTAYAYACYRRGDWNGVFYQPSLYNYESVDALRERMQEEVDSDFKVEVDDENLIGSTTAHEMGHILDYFLGASSDKKLRDYYIFFATMAYDASEAVSSYAKTSIGEFVAECMCEYVLSSNPRTVAKMIGEYIDNMYQEKVKFLEATKDKSNDED
jgi:hypothetical protein